jgi:hypothetical protein
MECEVEPRSGPTAWRGGSSELESPDQKDSMLHVIKGLGLGMNSLVV